MKRLFIKTAQQEKWIKNLEVFETKFKSTSAQTDELASFPLQNIHDLQHIGYTGITLPKADGGEGLGVYEMVLLQETLASYDSNTALSIG